MVDLMMLTSRNLQEYEWDYDTGRASFTYEDPYVGETLTTYSWQFKYWVPPRWRAPVQGGFNDTKH